MALLLVGGIVQAQIVDQIVLYGTDHSFLNQIARFDRKLKLLGMTQTTFVGAGAGVLDPLSGVGLDAQGRYWVPFDGFNDTKVLRMESNGALILPSVNLQHNPNFLATAPSGITYVLSRIPLFTAGPLYGLSPAGMLLGSNPAGPQLFYFYPQLLELTPAGQVWIGGVGAAPTQGEVLPQLVHVSATGAVLEQALFPKPVGSIASSVSMTALAAAPDGTLWSFFDPHLTHIDGLRVVQQVLTTETYTRQLRVDAQGNLLTVGVDTPPPFETQLIKHYDASSLTVMKEYPIGGLVTQYGGTALGPGGEDLYVTGGAPPPTYPLRLWRINLVTGTKSSVSLDELGIDWVIPQGDPTGFIWANVKDQQGDADGDGAANRAETLAGSNPFDPTSRPEGPKVYISFAPTTNALVLTYVDPDGLLDPQGGLDLSTLSVTIGNFGNVFWFLVPFVTALDLSPDMKKATLTFGALPLPLDKKWEVEATIADLTGATGWDWQVTPPGDL